MPAPPSPTSTTTAVDFRDPSLAPRIPELESILSLCGFEADVGPFEQIVTVSPARTKELMEGVVPMLARYGEVAPETAKADLVGLQEAFQRLVPSATGSWCAPSYPRSRRCGTGRLTTPCPPPPPTIDPS